MPRNTISKSGFRFVHLHTDGRYSTYVLHEGKRLHVGLYPSQTTAAVMHDSIAWHLLGERRSSRLSIPNYSESNPPPRYSEEIAEFARKHNIERAGRPADPFFDSGQGEAYLVLRHTVKQAEIAYSAAREAHSRLVDMQIAALAAMPPQYRAML